MTQPWTGFALKAYAEGFAPATHKKHALSFSHIVSTNGLITNIRDLFANPQP